MDYRKFILRSAVLVLTLVMLVPLIAVATGAALPGWVYPYAGIASGFLLALTSWYLATAPQDRRNKAPSRAQLFQEAAALNYHAMVCLTDEKSRIFYVNDKFLDATGYEISEIIGRDASIYYPEDERHVFEAIRDGLQQGSPWSGETRMICRDGDRIWTQATIVPRLDRRGRLVGTISIRTDITSVKAAAEQKDLFTTLHNLRDEVYMIDPATLAFVYINEAGLTRLGWREEDYRGKSLHHDHWDLDELRFRDRISPLIAGEADLITYEDAIGDTPYEIRIQLIETYSGRKRLVAVLRDVSEQAELERTKSEFLAAISHELRTPMTSIKGAMGLLLSNAAGDLPDKARDMLSIAHRNADRLVVIINDILDIEKMAAGEMEFDMQTRPLAMVIEEAISANEQFADRFDVTVEKADFDATLAVEYDFGRTLQVLTNLLSNAAKFSPAGGRIIVSLTTRPGAVRISVQDFGDGLTEDARAKVFNRFSQPNRPTRRGAVGTGLGLSIAKAIMEKQNGTIDVQSDVGQGSTFYVEFPQMTPDAEDPSGAQTATGQPGNLEKLIR